MGDKSYLDGIGRGQRVLDVSANTPYPSRSERDIRSPLHSKGTDTLSVPDYIPQLVRGKSYDPKEGGCLIQLANWFCDPTRWDDRPGLVHETLRTYGIAVNDVLDDSTRRELALLIPRLTDTARYHDYLLDATLARWVSTHSVRDAYYGTRTSGEIVWMFTPALPNSEKRVLAWFTELLDLFDELTGRDKTSDFTPDQWTQIRNPVVQAPEGESRRFVGSVKIPHHPTISAYDVIHPVSHPEGKFLIPPVTWKYEYELDGKSFYMVLA